MGVVCISRSCVICADRITMEIDPDALERWRNGELIQIAMPELPIEFRELLISGICPRCFDAIFAKEA